MAEGAIHGVNLQAFNQVVVGYGNWTVHAWSVALDGTIERAHADLALHFWRSRVRARGQKTEQGKANRDEQQEDDGEDDAQNEFAHCRTLSSRRSERPNAPETESSFRQYTSPGSLAGCRIQYACRRRASRTTSLTFGRKNSSCGGENGTGESSEARRTIGPSRSSKASSLIMAEISPASPAVR